MSFRVSRREDRVPPHRLVDMWTHYCTPACTACQSAGAPRQVRGDACPTRLTEFHSRTGTAEQEPKNNQEPESETKDNGHTPQCARGKREEQRIQQLRWETRRCRWRLITCHRRLITVCTASVISDSKETTSRATSKSVVLKKK